MRARPWLAALLLIAPLASADEMPSDGDADGVPDARDECRTSPTGVVIDDRGCALDSDYDGVPDGPDACPKTDVGAPVDPRGCTLEQVIEGRLPPPEQPIVPRAALETRAPEQLAPAHAGPEPEPLPVPSSALRPLVPVPIEPPAPAVVAEVPATDAPVATPEPPAAQAATPPAPAAPAVIPAPPPAPETMTVLFPAGGSDLDAAALKQLDAWLPELRSALAASDGARVRVLGFGDRRSEPRGGEKLAAGRAELVRSYLIARGLDRRRVLAQGRGFGEAPAARDNRRVEIRPE